MGRVIGTADPTHYVTPDRARHRTSRSGKSTLAAALASLLDLPLIAKDRFKEILFDALGVGDMEWSRRLGAAAVALQFDAMRTVRSAVVDSALWTDLGARARGARASADPCRHVDRGRRTCGRAAAVLPAQPCPN